MFPSVLSCVVSEDFIIVVPVVEPTLKYEFAVPAINCVPLQLLYVSYPVNEKDPFSVRLPAGDKIKLPPESLIPSIGSIVIFSTPPDINEIFGVAGFNVILLLDITELYYILYLDLLHTMVLKLKLL